MNRTIDRMKIFFLGLFVVLNVLAWGYSALYVWPKKACEAQRNWWDAKDRVCATPIPLWTITGRELGKEPSRVAAEEAKRFEAGETTATPAAH